MTPEQLKWLKEKQNEIITMAMGKCWHDSKDGYYCYKCGAYLLDEDSVHIISNPTYSTPDGWFVLYNWLTKENPEWWRRLYYNLPYRHYYHDTVQLLIDNLPYFFVQWLIETETGWWEECECKEYNLKETDLRCPTCKETEKKLTPLGALMKEVLK